MRCRIVTGKTWETKEPTSSCFCTASDRGRRWRHPVSTKQTSLYRMPTTTNHYATHTHTFCAQLACTHVPALYSFLPLLLLPTLLMISFFAKVEITWYVMFLARVVCLSVCVGFSGLLLSFPSGPSGVPRCSVACCAFLGFWSRFCRFDFRLSCESTMHITT